MRILHRRRHGSAFRVRFHNDIIVDKVPPSSTEARIVLLVFHDLSDLDQNNPTHVESLHKTSLLTNTIAVINVPNAPGATGWRALPQRCHLQFLF